MRRVAEQRSVRAPSGRGRGGFTLIELLLALAIFAMVMAMAGGAFWSVMKAWNRGEAVLGQLHRGEYAMEQIVSALRGAAWFPSKPESYGFWLDDAGGDGESAENVVSFVTAGSAFLPPDSLLRDGLHRMELTVDGSGASRALVVRAWAHVVDDLDDADKQEWRVLEGVKGFACEYYDFEDEDWSQDWETTNTLPKLVRVTLTMAPQGEMRDSLKLQRLVALEVAPEVPGRERRAMSRRGAHDDGNLDGGGQASRTEPENRGAGVPSGTSSSGGTSSPGSVRSGLERLGSAGWRGEGGGGGRSDEGTRSGVRIGVTGGGVR